MVEWDFHGSTAVITGASQGIGRVLALCLAQYGCRLALIARRADSLAEVANRTKDPRQHLVISADLSVPGAGAKVARTILEEGFEPNILLHCVGASLGKRDIFGPEEDWRLLWEVNAGQPIAMNNILVPVMVTRGYGRVLHLSSRSAETGSGSPGYAAAKAYLNIYVRALSRSVAASNVLVNVLSTSAVSAEGNNWSKAEQNNPDNVDEYLKNHQAIGRLGRPEDLIPFAMLCLSSENRFAAGSILSVDGAAY